MGNEIGEISQIINTSIRGIDISVRLTKEILSMLKRLIEILEAATFRRGLRKTTGKTLLSTLKMKGNIFSAKMTEDVYKEFQSFLKRKGKSMESNGRMVYIRKRIPPCVYSRVRCGII